MKAKIVKVDNNLFNKKNKLLITINIETKKSIMSNLFAEAESFIVVSADSSKNDKPIIILNGEHKNFNYCMLENKYFWVIKTNFIYEANLIKTKIYLEYDEINNSEITMKDFENNTHNNNFFLERTNIKGIENTNVELIKCSEICSGIINKEVENVENIYKWSRKLGTTNYNSSILIVYFLFSSYHFSGQKKRPPILYVLDKMFGEKLKLPSELDNFKIYMSVINDEYVNYVPLIFELGDRDGIRPALKDFSEFIEAFGKITEIDEFIDNIKFDIVPKDILKDENLIPIFTNEQEIACYIYSKSEWDKGICEINNLDVAEIDFENNFNHIELAHYRTSLFSKKWNSRILLNQNIKKIFLKLVVGVDNTYIHPFWGDGKYIEPFDDENININTSMGVNAQPYLTRTEKESNNMLSAGISAITQALGITGGALFSGGMQQIPAMATMLGVSSVGGALGKIMNSSMGYALEKKPKVKGGILGTQMEKRYISNKTDEFDRLSVFIQRNYLSDTEKKTIQNDRHKRGDFYNKNQLINFSKILYGDETFLKGQFIDFSIGVSNVNLTNEIIKKTNEGVYINTMFTNNWIDVINLSTVLLSRTSEFNKGVSTANFLMTNGTYRIEICQVFGLPNENVVLLSNFPYRYIEFKIIDVSKNMQVTNVLQVTGATRNFFAENSFELIYINNVLNIVSTQFGDNVQGGIISIWAVRKLQKLDTEEIPETPTEFKTINGKSITGNGDLKVTARTFVTTIGTDTIQIQSKADVE